MRVVLSAAAAKRLRRLQPRLRIQLEDALAAVAANPFGHHANVKPLVGFKDAFRLRRGDWRVIYRVDRAKQLVLVEAIETRGDVYK